jgi:hypothetical protein
MKTVFFHRLVRCILAFAGLLAVTATQAEIRSQSKELIVMEPHDLPELAQNTGDSMFLHSDNGGNTYLYVEQKDGARLLVFDVTDPGQIKVASTIPLTEPRLFDFVRPLGQEAELIRLRGEGVAAVLDMHKARQRIIRAVSALADPGSTVSLGETAFLAVNGLHNEVPSVSRDYQVVDISTPCFPALLATVKQVKYQAVNAETGTTFLLGSDGLTVVRRISIETDYKEHQSLTN